MKIGCPRCGADVYYEPSIDKCICNHCKSTIEVSEFKIDDYEVKSAELYDEFHCESCGAKLVTDNTTVITRCVFCGSQQIVKQRLSGEFKPNFIAPFRINKEKFLEIYKDFIKRARFVPESFKNEQIINEIKGLYVPFYFYKYKVKNYGRGRESEYKGWHDFDKSYTLLVPVDGSTELDNELMNSLILKELTDFTAFNPVYITGMQCKCVDENKEVLKDNSEERVLIDGIVDIGTMFDMQGIESGKFTIDMCLDSKPVIALMPVWLVSVRYKNKFYYYAVNGRTGDIGGKLPINNAIFYSFLFFLAMMISFVTFWLYSLFSANHFLTVLGFILSYAILGFIFIYTKLHPYIHIKIKDTSYTKSYILPRKKERILLDKKYYWDEQKEFESKYPNEKKDRIILEKRVEGELKDKIIVKKPIKSIRSPRGSYLYDKFVRNFIRKK